MHYKQRVTVVCLVLRVQAGNQKTHYEKGIVQAGSQATGTNKQTNKQTYFRVFVHTFHHKSLLIELREVGVVGLSASTCRQANTHWVYSNLIVRHYRIIQLVVHNLLNENNGRVCTVCVCNVSSVILRIHT